MDETKTIETIDVTDPDQIDRDPVISALPEPDPDPEQGPDETVEPADEDEGIEPAAEEEPEAEEEAPPAATDEVPEMPDGIGARIESLENTINSLFETINSLTATINNINRIEEERAAGPQGFFKPVEDKTPGSPDNEGPARIIRNYF